MRTTYSIIALIYGVLQLLLTFLWSLIPFAFLQSENTFGIAFVISAIMAIPFVTSYTKFGLNSDESDGESPETQARHAALKQECPIWHIAWYSGIGFIMLVWFGYLVFQLPVHPFFAFSGVISSLTGIWFMFVYPVANRLFAP